MNNLQFLNNFTTAEQGLKNLKEAVALRDSMGGSMYWNMCNDDCCKIANKVSSMGADKKEISAILGEGTHQVS